MWTQKIGSAFFSMLCEAAAVWARHLCEAWAVSNHGPKSYACLYLILAIQSIDSFS